METRMEGERRRKLKKRGEKERELKGEGCKRRVWSIGSKQGHHPTEASSVHMTTTSRDNYANACNVHMHAAFSYAAW
jgi:hypothetical protein